MATSAAGRQQYSEIFLEALKSGRICLHPTDSLPGLTFDPSSDSACQAFRKIKGRDQAIGFVCLIESLARAQNFWQPLPTGWQDHLTRLWPGPLSVIWRANDQSDRRLQGPGETLCLRVPNLDDQALWMGDVLKSWQRPLPSTSVNRPGQPPAVQWLSAQQFINGYDHSFVPPWHLSKPSGLPTAMGPSTIIELQEDGSYLMVREGLIGPQQLTTLLQGGR